MDARGVSSVLSRNAARHAQYSAFIDLNHIYELNEHLGYNEVDRRVKEMFSVSFRRSDIVARWYSGDEIVILFDGSPAEN